MTEDQELCRLHPLTGHDPEVVQARLIEENPANALAFSEVDGLDAAKLLALPVQFLWKPDRVLRIGFLQADAAHGFYRDKVREYLAHWAPHVDLELVIVDDVAEADIRITFERDDDYGSFWSYLGASALLAPSEDATLGLAWGSTELAERWYARRALHELGHALGAVHEHQSPAAHIPWDRPAVYRHYERLGWTKEQVDRNVLSTWPAEGTDYSAFDPTSIMMYPISGDLTDDHFETGWHFALSDLDRQRMQETYSSVRSSAWQPIVEHVAYGPAAARPTPESDELQVVGVNMGARLTGWRWDGSSWSAGERLSDGWFDPGMTMTSDGAGTLHLMALQRAPGRDNLLAFHRTNGTWSGPTRLPLQTRTRPALVARPGHADMVTIADRKTQHWTWSGSEWSEPVDLGITAHPYQVRASLVATAPGQLHAFVVNPDSRVVHWSSDGTTEVLDGMIYGPATAVASGPERIDLFAVDLDGASQETFSNLLHRRWDGSTWTDWETIPAQLVNGGYQLVAAERSAGVFQVVTISAHGELVGLHLDDEGASPWTTLGAKTGQLPALARGSGRLDLVIVSNINATLQRLGWSPSGWGS
ncbi:MAG: hypothetical protein AAF533_12260 [Acidobacteriota bacterium]